MTGPRDGFVLGVDLGTSHTVAMLHWPDGRTRPLLFDGRPLLPSAVFLDTTGRLHVGADAQRLGHAEPDRYEPHPKRHIDAATVLLGGTAVPVADLFAGLLAAVAREAVAAAGMLPPAVLTYPAAWGARRRETLQRAVAQAGWPAATRLVPEPVAAARYFADVLRRPVPVGSSLAVFDFGGGTLDVAVVRNDGRDGFVVAASGGLDDLGGLDVDAALAEHLGKTLAGAEPQAWDALTDPVTLAQWRARRQFWDDVRGAKEMLSRTTLAPVPVPGVEHAVHLTRDELEAAATPLIRRGVSEAAAVIKAAGVAPGELAGLFLVGGSSRVPLVSRLLHSELGIAPTVLEQPELPVAEGAVVTASPEAGPEVAAGSSVVGDGGAVRPGETPVRYQPGHAAAAAPTPTAETVPNHPPVPAPITDTVPDGPVAAPGGSHAAVPGGPAAGSGGPHAAGSGGPAASRGGSHAAGSAGPAASSGGPHAAGSGGLAAGSGGPAVADSEPKYAEPVDPWATGEAAAFGGAPGAFSGPPGQPGSGGAPAFGGAPAPGSPASVPPTLGYDGPHQPWLASTEQRHGEQRHGEQGHGDPGHGDPERPRPARPLYRRKGFWLVAAATAVVLAAGSVLAVVLWPGYGSLDYRPLSVAARFPAAVPLQGLFNDTETIGDRTYYASTDDNGTLGVVAVDTGEAKKVWANPAVATATEWESLVALPGGFAATSEADSDTRQKLLVVGDADDGKVRWRRTISDADGVLFVADVAVLVDRVANRVVGLDVDDGKQRWALDTPKSASGSVETSVIPAVTADDLTGPAGTTGRPFSPDLDDDTRIVQIGADESARVIDAKTGKTEGPVRAGVAAPSDGVLVYGDRMIVLDDATPKKRVLSYDLKTQREPTVLYTAPPNSQLEKLTPCGAERVCWIESIAFQDPTAQVAGIDVAEATGLWHRGVPSADTLVPVGDSVLVTTDGSPATVSLLDAEGAVTWTHSDDTVVRLDAGNLLHFDSALSTGAVSPALSGEHVGDDAVPLGTMRDVRSSTCSWNTSTIACLADEDLVLYRFTG